MKRLAIAIITLLCLLLVPASAAAYNPLSRACSIGGVGNSSVCASSGAKPGDPITGTLFKVTSLVALVGGVVAVIVIIIAGLTITISADDAQRVSTARRAIVGSIVALVIIVSAESIIVFVVSKL